MLIFNVGLCFFLDTLEALLELLKMQMPASTEPEKLVREAAQGHIDIVREILSKHPDKVHTYILVSFNHFTIFSKSGVSLHKILL